MLPCPAEFSTCAQALGYYVGQFWFNAADETRGLNSAMYLWVQMPIKCIFFLRTASFKGYFCLTIFKAGRWFNTSKKHQSLCMRCPGVISSINISWNRLPGTRVRAEGQRGWVTTHAGSLYSPSSRSQALCNTDKHTTTWVTSMKQDSYRHLFYKQTETLCVLCP